MRKKLLFLLVPCVCAVIQAQDSLTVEMLGLGIYRPKTLRGFAWRPDGTAYTFLEEDAESKGQRILMEDVKSGDKKILLDSRNAEELGTVMWQKRFMLPNYIWSPDSRSILLPSGTDLFLADAATGSVRRLTEDDEEERDPVFSPDGKKLAYLKNDNLCRLDLYSGIEIQLTTTGTQDLLIGRFDWVYEEEFSIRTGFAWSPDGKSIAYFELDQSPEPVFPIVDFEPVHNTVTPLRYPKAGDANALVRIGVVPEQGGETVWMDLGPEKDIYIPRIAWFPDSKRLAIQRLNRKQNRLDLLEADAATGRTAVMLTETDPYGWVDVQEHPVFLKNSPGYLWLSQRDNWNHIYLYDDYSSRDSRQLTRGNWDVTQILSVDEKAGWIYFTATEASVLDRHLYRVRPDGTGFERLTRDPGTHNIQMAPDASFFIDVFSNVETPHRTTLHRSDGRRTRVLEKGDIPALKPFRLSIPEFFYLNTDDGLRLNAFIMKPHPFDPKKKYPVLMHVYGVPVSLTSTQTVDNSWYSGKGALWHQLLLQKGYLIFAVENRGTAFLGDDFQNRVYGDLSKGLEDQVRAAKYLKSLPYVDSARVGIWGASGGGHMTCLAMTKAAGVFKAGIALSSVTDPRNYDTIWTERYMGLPSENPGGYDAASALHYIPAYRGGLLLIHGASDDNVHLSNTMQMARRLQAADKPFSMMIYPNQAHGFHGTGYRAHYYHLMTEFILKQL
ncbi:DPP IV N-terminal domain-containing protein [bacterium]|nr:DPP IV N-terminal domain-containing protein [bacterium]